MMLRMKKGRMGSSACGYISLAIIHREAINP